MNNSTIVSKVFIQTEIAEIIWKIIPPIFIIVGSIGNLLSVIVLTRPKIIKSTSAFYLIVLAFSDTVVLYTGLMRHWIEHAFQWNVRHLSEPGCKTHVFMTYLSLDFSAWLLVAVTLDRLVLVWFPHKAKRKYTRTICVCVICTIFVVLIGINSHILYGTANRHKTVNNVTTFEKCDFLEDDYEFFFNETWPWIDFSIFSLIPFCILLVGNTLICIKLLMWRKSRKRRRSSNTRDAEKSEISSITLMLFTLNTVFLISTTPISIFNIVCEQNRDEWTEADKASDDLSWSICNILMYMTNAFNFLLYIFSGSRFRNEAKLFFLQCVYNLTRRNTAYKLTLADKDKITNENGV